MKILQSKLVRLVEEDSYIARYIDLNKIFLTLMVMMYINGYINTINILRWRKLRMITS